MLTEYFINAATSRVREHDWMVIVLTKHGVLSIEDLPDKIRRRPLGPEPRNSFSGSMRMGSICPERSSREASHHGSLAENQRRDLAGGATAPPEPDDLG